MQPAAGQRAVSGIDHTHFPVATVCLVVLYGAIAEIDSDITMGCVIAEEIVFDHLTLVAQSEDETLDLVVRINVHEVPEDGMHAHFDHWLGPHRGFLGQARSKTASENDSSHAEPASCRDFLYNQLIIMTVIN